MSPVVMVSIPPELLPQLRERVEGYSGRRRSAFPISTFTSAAAARGAGLTELTARMGHSSTWAALIYLHAAQDRDQAIAKALGEAFRTAAGTKIEN
ncbi:hypothetical protein ABZ860_41700 [Microbispora sp. NPDC046973]|uniref:hypothetical protein n=1 Tax=Microbispora sp. NPDC046973 TaxID=3155022 RepID=UPI0033C8698C